MINLACFGGNPVIQKVTGIKLKAGLGRINFQRSTAMPFNSPGRQTRSVNILDLKLITADEAYHDSDGSLFEQSGVHLVKPPDSKVCLPDNVDRDTLQVTFDDLCDVPMNYIGIEEQGHEFKCAAQPGQCPRSELCAKYRHIDFDNGYFQRILYGSDTVSKALDIRKVDVLWGRS